MDFHKARDQHKFEVRSFLRKNFSNANWEIVLPQQGTGNETYFASSYGRAYFIKLGAKIERYQVMSELGLAPQVIEKGYLEDGTSILVQQQIYGRKPSRKDFHRHMKQFARAIYKTHQEARLKRILPERSSNAYKDVGLEMLGQVVKRWQFYKSKIPAFIDEVEEGIAYLTDQLSRLQGNGLVASHNDICNGNWLVSSDKKVYLLDYDSMSQDDPALDLGAILWWYYPPNLRAEFLEIAGYRDDESFRHRMQIRMAIHNLNIILPREKSFDKFDLDTFDEALEDFRAVIKGEENPQGYSD